MMLAVGATAAMVLGELYASRRDDRATGKERLLLAAWKEKAH